MDSGWGEEKPGLDENFLGKVVFAAGQRESFNGRKELHLRLALRGQPASGIGQLRRYAPSHGRKVWTETCKKPVVRTGLQLSPSTVEGAEKLIDNL